MVRKVVGADGKTSYSGNNVTGEVSFQGVDGNALRGRPGGGFMSYGGMSKEQIDRTLNNPDGSRWSEGDNAIMAANMRDGVDKYRGTSRDARNDPMNQPMTKDQRAARVRLAETAMQDKRYGEQNAIQREQLEISRTEHVSKMAKEKQATDAINALMSAKTPDEIAAAKRNMVALGLMKETAAVRQMVVPGGQGFDANGTPYTIASSVYDPDTKQFIKQDQGQGGKPAQAAPDFATYKAHVLAKNAGMKLTDEQLQAQYNKQFNGAK